MHKLQGKHHFYCTSYNRIASKIDEYAYFFVSFFVAFDTLITV